MMTRAECIRGRTWRSAVLVAGAAMLLAGRLAAVAADDPQPAPTDTPVVEAATLVTTQAKVMKIEQKDRLVLLKGPQGNVFVVLVDDSVQNLAQVKVGDNVNVRYYEAMAIEVKKASKAKPGVIETIKTDKGVPGQRPAGVMSTQVTANLEVLLVNQGDDSVTFKGPKGRTRWVKVKDPDLKSSVKDLKVGDIVTITLIEALAVGVDPA